jgi:hypothetical protein
MFSDRPFRDKGDISGMMAVSTALVLSALRLFLLMGLNSDLDRFLNAFGFSVKNPAPEVNLTEI